MTSEDKLKPVDYEQLNPGIRDLVRELREVHKFETTDSGDGTNYANGMECAMKERHVAMVTEPTVMVYDAVRLQDLYPDAYIECSWSPKDADAVLLLFPDGQILPDWIEEKR